MGKNKSKKLIIISAISIIVLVGIIVGSYAYFSSKSEQSRTVQAGQVDIHFSDENPDINMKNIQLVYNDSEIESKAVMKSFTITNNDNNPTTVAMSITDITLDKNFSDAISNLRYVLYLNDNIISKGNFNYVTESNNSKLLLSNINLDSKSKTDTYKLYLYFVGLKDKNQNYLQKMTLSAKVTILSEQLVELVKVNDLYNFDTDSSGANAPDLIENSLIPVAFSIEEKVWYKVNSEEQTTWYNYNNQKWANAITVSSPIRSLYKNAPAGTIIPMDDIETMWVWIPRFNYDTTNLGISYAGGTKEQPGEIKVSFASSTASSAEDNNYTHPAFTFGEKELTGIGVAKFEMSSDCLNNASTKSSSDCTSNGGGNTTNEKALIKPNMKSWRYNTVSNFFTVSRTLSATNNSYGISESADSHMMKNTEWGAVAYLSQSKYGKYGNSDYTGVNKEIYKNDSSNYYTGRSKGIAPATGSSTANGTYEYDNPINGTGASTTGNIYGIYDMSGGAFEYVMGNYNNTVGNSGFNSSWFSDTNNQKYYDNYTSTLASEGYIKGDATYETSGWYNDHTGFVDSSYPWFMRGGVNAGSTEAGIFFFNSNDGLNRDRYASRISLVH